MRVGLILTICFATDPTYTRVSACFYAVSELTAFEASSRAWYIFPCTASCPSDLNKVGQKSGLEGQQVYG